MARPKVLYIDHNLPWRKSYKNELGAIGYDVVVARTGSYALSIIGINLKKLDAVVLDYEMPGIRGHELSATIKLFRPALPIIIVSDCESVVQDAFAFVDSALSKSSDIAKLLQQLRMVMGEGIRSFSTTRSFLIGNGLGHAKGTSSSSKAVSALQVNELSKNPLEKVSQNL